MILHKYKVWCATDSKWEYIWREDGQGAPTTCPVDTAHTIGVVSIAETKEDTQVEIKEEAVATGGHAQIQSIIVVCDATTGWKESILTFPYPISIIDGFWSDKPENEADEAQMLIGEQTIVGAIGADVTASDTAFTVSQTVLDNVDVGYYIHLYDGTNEDDCGRIISIDLATSQITCETGAVNAFSAATPTYVKMTIKMVPKIEFTGVGAVYNVTGGVGAASIPANTDIKVRYNNKSGTAKRFIATLEYFY